MSAKNKIIIFSSAVIGALVSFVVVLFLQPEKRKKTALYSPEPIQKIKLPETEIINNEPITEQEEILDDLKIIEGIGPKISTILNENNITTFQILSEKTAEQLKTILIEANIRIADPTTWPEQAALAAQGKWEQLQTLQDTLKGGRPA